MEFSSLRPDPPADEWPEDAYDLLCDAFIAAEGNKVFLHIERTDIYGALILRDDLLEVLLWDVDGFVPGGNRGERIIQDDDDARAAVVRLRTLRNVLQVAVKYIDAALGDT